MCEYNDGGRKDPQPGPSAVKDKKGRWDDEEADTDDEEEEEEDIGESNGGCDKKKTLLLRSIKKRSLPTAGGKPRAKRIKRRRFSSPLSLDEETEMDDESDISSYTPSKPYYVSNSPLNSSHLAGPEGGTSDDGTTEFVGGRSNRRAMSRMAVIYEQQRWNGEIIDERDAKQGRGRPRKRYLLQWKTSWVDAGRLTAPTLVQT
jgi:hypothetical protein